MSCMLFLTRWWISRRRTSFSPSEASRRSRESLRSVTSFLMAMKPLMLLRLVEHGRDGHLLGIELAVLPLVHDFALPDLAADSIVSQSAR